jgi:hypothetical protein
MVSRVGHGFAGRAQSFLVPPSCCYGLVTHRVCQRDDMDTQIPLKITAARFVRSVGHFVSSEAGWKAKVMFAAIVALLCGANGLDVANSYVGRNFMTSIADQVPVTGSPIGQPMNEPRITMKGEDDWLVGCEKGVEVAIVEAVRMLAWRLKLHQVDDVDAHFNFGRVAPQQLDRGERL